METSEQAARRAEILDRYGIMDTPPEEVFEQIVRDAAFLTGAPVSTITMVDDERQWFKAKLGLEHDGTSLEQSICAVAVRSHDMLVVGDASADARFRGLDAVVQGDLRFYAGIPLAARDGTRIGTLCVIDNEARAGLTEGETDALEALARRAVAALEVRRDLRDGHGRDGLEDERWIARAGLLLDQAAAALSQVGATGPLAHLETVIDLVRQHGAGPARVGGHG